MTKSAADKPPNRKRWQEVFLHGIDTSLAMTTITYSRLCDAVLQYSQAATQGGLTPEINNLILLYAWSLIDITNRLRVLVRQTPGLKQNAPVQSFLKATEHVETLRHFVQHLDGEGQKLAETGWPIWGSLSWIRASFEMLEKGRCEVEVYVPGPLAKSKGYPAVNPLGKEIRAPVDHISLSVPGTTVNLSEIARCSMLFGNRLRTALDRAKQIEIERTDGARETILGIILDIGETDQISD